MTSKSALLMIRELSEQGPIAKKIKREEEDEEVESNGEKNEKLNSTGEADSEEPDSPSDSDVDKEEDENHLTEEQDIVFRYVRNLMLDENFRKQNPTAICIEGLAGTGKTEILKMLCNYANKIRAGSAVFTASSGIAAMNYTEGRTAHSKFDFPLGKSPPTNRMCKMYDEFEILNSNIMVLDEVNMASKNLIEMLDRTLRNLLKNNKMFGGKIIVFAGDFRQVQAINKDDDDIDTAKLSLKRSLLWTEMKHFELKTPIRTKNDPYYSVYLKQLSKGFTPSKYIKNYIYVPLEGIKYTMTNRDFIKFVYPDNILEQPDLAAKRSILTVNNETAELYNGFIFANYGSNEVTNYKAVKGFHARNDFFSERPEINLKLKKGSVCMFIRNVYEPATFLTGAKVIIEELNEGSIGVRKPGREEVYQIQRECYFDAEYQDDKWQFPLKLAYATTIHKSQGQELDKIGLDLREPMFEKGLLYMALSRVRSRDDVKVLVTSKDQLSYGTPYAIQRKTLTTFFG